ncbi:MAG: trypsin-like peptidase domain-containing protein [Betaproteobacteria bacterium]
MTKVALYSSSSRARKAGGASASASVGAAPADIPAGPPGDVAAPSLRARWRGFRQRHARPLFAAGGAVVALAAVALHAALSPSAREYTQQDIDAAVLHTLENARLPAPEAKAYEAVRRSVVRVRGYGHDREKDKDGNDKDAHAVQGVGSGVVIVDTGIILTNMHVVVGAERITVEFDDGLESEAVVTGVRPEHDLAVLQAKKLPDDLPAATLRTTGDLAPGDKVIAVGFPFGIGPSVSAGVVSGLRREYRSPEGQRVLTNLIQFDAAANPGNSGGPLVTIDGEVVGIVTGILNPTPQRVFIGIGFAVPIENAASAIGLLPI